MKYEYKGSPAPWGLPEKWNAPMHAPGCDGRPGFESRSAYIEDYNGDILAVVKAFETTGFVKKDVYEANALLILAAPLLLSALIKAVEFCDKTKPWAQETWHYPPWYAEAKTAIEAALNLKPENAQP